VRESARVALGPGTSLLPAADPTPACTRALEAQMHRLARLAFTAFMLVVAVGCAANRQAPADTSADEAASGPSTRSGSRPTTAVMPRRSRPSTPTTPCSACRGWPRPAAKARSAPRTTPMLRRPRRRRDVHARAEPRVLRVARPRLRMEHLHRRRQGRRHGSTKASTLTRLP